MAVAMAITRQMAERVEADTTVTAYDAAPGQLNLVQALMGTGYAHGRYEEFRAPEDVRLWLHAHARMAEDARVTEGDVRRIIAFREALRALLRANNGGVLDPTAIARLNALAMHAPLRVQFEPSGDAAFQPEIGGVDGALGVLLSAVVVAMRDGSWARLKACHNERCEHVYYDTSKNRTRRWCAMASCGSRAKMRAYRARHRQDAIPRG